MVIQITTLYKHGAKKKHLRAITDKEDYECAVCCSNWVFFFMLKLIDMVLQLVALLLHSSNFQSKQLQSARVPGPILGLGVLSK